MPEMDGLALARAIKADATLAATRLVLLSSLGDRLSESELKAVGLAAALVFGHLRELDGPDGAEALREIIGAFLEDTPKRLADLRAACQQADTHTARRAAHSLVGSCGNLGALRLADLCRRVEHGVRQEAWTETKPLLGAVEAEFERVREALEKEARGGKREA
jgi:HPt (histidine-containing phosphotransfer) domain-containing protein